MGLFEEKRTVSNVFWNGLAPFIFVMLRAPLSYVVAVAALLADKFASELGVLEGEAVELFTWKKVKAGKSGCVSITGLLASFLGSAVIAIISKGVFGFSWTNALFVALMGFIGSLLDSVVGYWEERGWSTKGLTNFIAAFLPALAVWLMPPKFQ